MTSTDSVNKTLSSNASIIQLHVEGMTCASCSARVERTLNRLPEVSHAQVNLTTEMATIEMDTAQLPLAVDAIEDAGYHVVVPQMILDVEGMTCASCVARVERVVKRLPNVVDAQVNLATEQAVVQGWASQAHVIAAIEDAGYVAKPLQAALHRMDEDKQARKAAEQQQLQRDFKWALGLSVPVFVLEMGGHLWSDFHHWISHHIGMQTSWLLQCVLTALVLLLPGRRFWQTGLPALFKGAPDMNSLVAVGSLAAFGFSSVATFLPDVLPPQARHVYYESAVVIITLILLGRVLEARAKGRTSEAIRRLVDLQSKTATIERDGQILTVDIAQVQRDDVVLVKPGERVAVDGVVVGGQSWVDEAMITGEPMPVEKNLGANVTGGTINQQGSLRVQASAVGDATVLAQIIRMVSEAQGNKLPIQAAVDKVTLWFVPAVMVLSLLTFALWWLLGGEAALSLAVVNAVAVLIIACPCAMGLATPTSIMVATGRGAELGVLFRQGSALQSLQEVSVVAVDKTGTLTEGKPQLTDMVLQDAFEREHVLSLVAAAESPSEHPIAQALLQAAQKAHLDIPSLRHFESHTGLGIAALTDAHHIHIGADRYMQQLGLDVSVWQVQAKALAAAGKSPLYVAIDGVLAAILAVSDPIKPSTPAAIAALHAQGLKVVMVSGDNRVTAEAIARQLGIDEVVAEVMPDGKVAVIQDLQHQGKVAFIGDGINDAPALAQADVGLAVGTGTDIAIESADVVLMNGRLTAVADAIALSRATMRNIHQNLFWAFAYNIALIPIAAGILYPFFGILLSPMLAAGAMALSSVFVLSNALRLRWFQA
ncbi:copper-transporting P-type ATPase [Vitreoscilla sp. C1]|uniref:heavy metal translocating P-type ATPase n=1 Tax=Vitreoscilla sp. (strain C1) TaxID=96942 RepID=UPI000CDC296D|nr:heavy metal translocating P-type ATPase [Vitreoscilla sp. C1]AUZ04894.1 copper-transporting P-type ATPase [Vitreoscilla sp. C1]